MPKTGHNPILSGFYPDPSICRAGSDFYLVTSTFAYFPGIPVFHSRDLLHWEQTGNVIDRPGQINFDGEGISRGLFAPTIRFHEGLFYVLCTAVDTGGNFIVTAKNPAGPWTDPVWLTSAPGIDPSIFFDDDRRVWYAGTRPAPEGEAYPGNWELWIQELDPAQIVPGKNPLKGEARGIWRGALRDCIWPEGPHLYKINGLYYLLHAEGGTGPDHAVCVARSRTLHGPWEGRASNPLLTHRHLGSNTDIINVGHADLVDDGQGNWQMVLLASRPFTFDQKRVCPLGRETFMVPVRWQDGWPYIATQTGLVEWEFSLPVFSKEQQSMAPQQCCDHFSSFPLHWLTLRMPRSEKESGISLSARPGYLRLFTPGPSMRGTEHPSFAGRRLQHRDWLFSAAMEFTPKQESECAGLVLLQSEDFQYRLELCLADGACSVRLIRAAGSADEIIAQTPCPELGGGRFVFAACSQELRLSFFYGPNQYSLKKLAEGIDGSILSTEYAGGFVGTVAGVFAVGNGAAANYADVAWAEYRGL
jgi:alpha-N-arabinofuranosidase